MSISETKYALADNHARAERQARRVEREERRVLALSTRMAIIVC